MGGREPILVAPSPRDGQRQPRRAPSPGDEQGRICRSSSAVGRHTAKPGGLHSARSGRSACYSPADRARAPSARSDQRGWTGSRVRATSLAPSSDPSLVVGACGGVVADARHRPHGSGSRRCGHPSIIRRRPVRLAVARVIGDAPSRPRPPAPSRSRPQPVVGGARHATARSFARRCRRRALVRRLVRHRGHRKGARGHHRSGA